MADDFELLTSDAAGLALTLANALSPQWGIYLYGEPIIASSVISQLGLGGLATAVNAVAELVNVFGTDLSGVELFSIVDFAFKQDYFVSQYQVEDGGFQSYDKVQEPFDIRMRIAAGGSDLNREALINKVSTIANDLNLYDIVTPELVYSSCNLVHWGYAKAAFRGVGLVIIDVWFNQIRVTSTADFTSTTSPTDAGQVGTGQTYPTTPTTAESQLVIGGFT